MLALRAKLIGENANMTLGNMTTINLTKIHGGTQSNVVPAEIKLSFDCRLPPNVDRHSFIRQVSYSSLAEVFGWGLIHLNVLHSWDNGVVKLAMWNLILMDAVHRHQPHQSMRPIRIGWHSVMFWLMNCEYTLGSIGDPTWMIDRSFLLQKIKNSTTNRSGRKWFFLHAWGKSIRINSRVLSFSLSFFGSKYFRPEF